MRKKISETFLQFASPVLCLLPEGAAPSEIEQMLRMPWLVWNALVLDHASGTDAYVSQVRQTAAVNAFGITVVEELIERKRRLFAKDNLLIGEYGVKKTVTGEIRLWAEARLPPATKRKPKRGGAQE